MFPDNLTTVNAFLLTLCIPAKDDCAAGDRLLRPAFGMYRIEWPTDDSFEFHLSQGDWIGLLRRSGFEIEDLVEIRRDQTRRQRIRSSRLSGHGNGQAKKYGRPANARRSSSATRE